MKGTSFQSPFEFNLVVEGESWRQGDPIQGTLIVKNRGTSDAEIPGAGITLAHGDLNKVRQKSPKAFKPISSITLIEKGSLGPGQENQFPWKFETDRNNPITDKTGSPFFLYGLSGGLPGGLSEKQGQLQLNFLPHALIEEFTNTLRIGFGFVFRNQKSNKGVVNIKFDPPSAKGFATLDELVLSCRFQGEILDLHYVFHLKKLDASAGMNLAKSKKEFEQSLEQSSCLLPSGRFNHETMEKALREAVDQIGADALLHS